MPLMDASLSETICSSCNFVPHSDLEEVQRCAYYGAGPLYFENSLWVMFGEALSVVDTLSFVKERKVENDRLRVIAYEY
jgi:hypothetical protein